MPRVLDPNLTALINSGHCEWFSTVDITLTDGTQVHLATEQRTVNSINYIAKLSGLDPLILSLTHEQDYVVFKVANVDQIMGQTLTGATRMLDGATATLGIVFVSDTGILYYDPKIQGDVLSGDVTDQDVSFELVTATDSVVISGRTVASAFPWREPLQPAPTSNPDDLVGGGHGLEDIIRRIRAGGGRYIITPPVEMSNQ